MIPKLFKLNFNHYPKVEKMNQIIKIFLFASLLAAAQCSLKQDLLKRATHIDAEAKTAIKR